MKIRILPVTFLLVFLLSACSLPGRTGNSVACLQGNWEMSNSDLNLMLATLVPVPGMSIPVGTFLMAFSGSDFSYGSEGFALRIEIPDGYMEADAAFLTTGTFSAEDGVITFSGLVSDREISTWRAVVDGEVVEVPGATSIDFPSPGSGPYTCSDTTLAITSVSGTGDPFVMIFTRLP
ncbi:MAG: hypothetical protein HY781_05355 [Chloroflexi bacterium]|nr:hypothetical protein [Chloroflexota bacterium]